MVLSPGTVILSLAGRSNLRYHLREHMNTVNLVIIAALKHLGVDSPVIKGISDIVLGTKKILGSSLYRRKDLVLYQGSLLVNPDLTMINRYLKQPRKQPEYRVERPHEDFVTSLHNEGYDMPLDEIVDALRGAFDNSSPWPPPVGPLPA